MIERTATGTGLVLKPDGKSIVSAADYEVWLRHEDKTLDLTAWGGELAMMTRIKPGEYVLELDPDDGRSGKINLQAGKLKKISGFKTYRYSFEGAGALVCEGTLPPYA